MIGNGQSPGAQFQLTLRKDRRMLRKLPWLISVLGVFIIGCSSQPPTTQPTTLIERQNQILRGYTQDGLNTDNRTVSGENDPNAFQKDLHNFFNP
jgi:hypothetical protein